MRCQGLHCGGCRSGRGGAVLAVIVAAVLIGAIGKAAGKALAEAGHVLAAVLEVVVLAVISAAGLGVLAALALAVVRLYRWRAARRSPHTHALEVIRARAEAIDADSPPAIEAPKPRLSPLVIPGQLAEIPRKEG